MNDYQLVRGMVEVDGQSERRWILAYQDGERWYGYDWDVIINEIDAIIQIDQLDILATRLKSSKSRGGVR